jgi:hypothetical protein
MLCFLRISILIIALLIQKDYKDLSKMAILISKLSKFKISGYLLLMISIIGITISLLGTKQTSETEILSDIIIYLLLIAIGIGLLAFSDVIKRKCVRE